MARIRVAQCHLPSGGLVSPDPSAPLLTSVGSRRLRLRVFLPMRFSPLIAFGILGCALPQGEDPEGCSKWQRSVEVDLVVNRNGGTAVSPRPPDLDVLVQREPGLSHEIPPF